MVQRHYKADFILSETFRKKLDNGNFEAMPVPDHVRIIYYTNSRNGKIEVERDGNTFKGCRLSEDGMTLLASVALSSQSIGQGRLLKSVAVVFSDPSFPGSERADVTPGATDIVLIEGPSDDAETFTDETVIENIRYGYSAYELACMQGFKGTLDDWLATIGTKAEIEALRPVKVESEEVMEAMISRGEVEDGRIYYTVEE